MEDTGFSKFPTSLFGYPWLDLKIGSLVILNLGYFKDLWTSTSQKSPVEGERELKSIGLKRLN